MIRVNEKYSVSVNGHMKGHFRHNLCRLIGRKNQAKFENDCVSRNGHRIKTTQPNSMILVSFSSAEDALFNDVKKCDTFRSQGTENPPFRFLGDTRYICIYFALTMYSPQILVLCKLTEDLVPKHRRLLTFASQLKAGLLDSLLSVY